MTFDPNKHGNLRGPPQCHPQEIRPYVVSLNKTLLGLYFLGWVALGGVP